MSTILRIATAVPPTRVTQDDVRPLVQRLFDGAGLDLDRLMPVFENTEIASRHISAPLDWFSESHSFADRNQMYVETALELSERAVRQVCDEAGVPPERIDHVFFVSTTGLATPSLDAHLLNRVGLRETVRRTPVWGLGCAGGVGGLGRAHDWLAGRPDGVALVIAVELCTLTFLKDDVSKRNFVATALFGDGCGVALLAGDGFEGASGARLRVDDVESVTWPETLDVMGWDVRDEGLKVVFSRSIPDIVRRRARPSLDTFLARHGLTVGDLDAFLASPGGAKVIAAYREALCLQEAEVEHTRAALRDYGNMSSATVFFVLKRFVEAADYRAGRRFLSCALGPGFSSEMLLGRSV